MPSASSRSRAARCASASLVDWLSSRSREDCRPRISSARRSPSWSTPAKMRTSSSSRRFSRPSIEVWRTWAMIANPSAAGEHHGEDVGPGGPRRAGPQQPAPGPLGAVGRAGAAGGSVRGRPSSRGRSPSNRSGSIAVRRPGGRAAGRRGRAGRCRSCVEQVPADGGDVGEDPHAEDDDHTGRELGADPELVAEEDDEGRDETLERNETTKTLSSKMPSRMARTRAEDGVERGDDGDGQVGLQPHRHGRLQEQADDDAEAPGRWPGSRRAPSRRRWWRRGAVGDGVGSPQYPRCGAYRVVRPTAAGTREVVRDLGVDADAEGAAQGRQVGAARAVGEGRGEALGSPSAVMT